MQLHCQRTPPTADPCTCSRSMRTCYIVMLQPVPHIGCEALQQVSPRSHPFSRACLPTESSRVCMLVLRSCCFWDAVTVSGMQRAHALLWLPVRNLALDGGGGSTAACCVAMRVSNLRCAVAPAAVHVCPQKTTTRACCCCTDKLLLFGVGNKQVK